MLVVRMVDALPTSVSLDIEPSKRQSTSSVIASIRDLYEISSLSVPISLESETRSQQSAAIIQDSQEVDALPTSVSLDIEPGRRQSTSSVATGIRDLYEINSLPVQISLESETHSQQSAAIIQDSNEVDALPTSVSLDIEPGRRQSTSSVATGIRDLYEINSLPVQISLESETHSQQSAAIIQDSHEVDAPPAPVSLDSNIYSQLSAAAAAESIRDPHDLPEFSTHKPLTIPVLYLPPLLSKLPDGFADTPNPSLENQPLTTATRLPNIDPVSLSLHRALHHFAPYSSDYATIPYAEAFNWSELDLPENEEREWYCVAFRSKRKAGSDSGSLYEADRRAHEEAVQNGGLIMYWYGIPDSDGYNLATCIWQSRRHAVAANSRPCHIVAMRLAAASFESFTLERHVLRKIAGKTGLEVERYTTGEVGW